MENDKRDVREYTAGHIDAIAERLRSAPANSMLGTHVTLGISDTAAAVRALDAYAATLRQQAQQPAVAVSDEMVWLANRALNKPGTGTMRAALTAVAPLLQSHTQGDAVAYFAADPAEGDFSTHDTLEAARADAEKMLGYAQDAASEEGWTDEPPQICYGIVVGKCVEKEGSRKPAPEGSEYAELVDYRLTAQDHPERAKVPDDVFALARRCLWLAYAWNDHNFERADIEARKEAQKWGINSFDEANEWLAAAPSPPAEVDRTDALDDEQWCETHDMQHSMELRDPDCEFPEGDKP